MMINRRNILLGAAATGICVALPASATQFLGGPAFGSTWRVMMPTSFEAPKVDGAITAVVAEIDALMSPWQHGSEISRFNSNRSPNWISLSPQVCTVLAESRVVADLTNGAFEPGVGPLVNRYGFGPIIGEPGTLAGLELRKNAVRKMSPDLTLDLCGIAKGYALDRAAVAMRAAGAKGGLIDLGGNILVFGAGPGHRVGIVDPDHEDLLLAAVPLVEAAAATSGQYERFLTIEGRKYGHILDPRTGWPAEGGISVTVISDRAILADALATAAVVLGMEKGRELLEKIPGVEGILAARQGDGFQLVTTTGYAPVSGSR
jgi:thiamine biosynthesis lipoprotein